MSAVSHLFLITVGRTVSKKRMSRKNGIIRANNFDVFWAVSASKD